VLTAFNRKCPKSSLQVEDVAELESLLKRGNSLSPTERAKVQKLMARQAERAKARHAAISSQSGHASGSSTGNGSTSEGCGDEDHAASSMPLAEHDLVVLEVVDFEKRYVSALQQLGAVSAALCEAPALLSPDDHKCLFSNLAQVIWCDVVLVLRGNARLDAFSAPSRALLSCLISSFLFFLPILF